MAIRRQRDVSMTEATWNRLLLRAKAYSRSRGMVVTDVSVCDTNNMIEAAIWHFCAAPGPEVFVWMDRVKSGWPPTRQEPAEATPELPEATAAPE